MIQPQTLVEWRRRLAPPEGHPTVTQAEAAKRLKVPSRTYQRWESAGCPNDAVLLAMAAVLRGLPPYKGSES